MKKGLLPIIAICMCFLSCHSRIGPYLIKIDALLNEYPDSALYVLMNINASDLHLTKDKAYYSLLLSAALDKNYIDVKNDSLINIASEFYSHRGSQYNRMRSYYYQGIIRKNDENYPAAIVSLEKAEQDAKALNDLRYLGLIYRNMGSIFNSTNNFVESTNYKKAAISCFNDNNDSIYALHTAYSLAVSYMNSAEGSYNSSDLDSCLFYNGGVQAYASDETLLAYSNILYAQALAIKGDSLQEAIHIYQNTPKSLLTYRDYGYCAYAYAKTGQADSVKKWTDQAYTYARSHPQEAVLNSLLFRIDSLEGRYPEALRKVTQAMAVQDSVTRVLLQQSLSVAQKNYYQNEAALQKSQMQQQRLLFIAIGIILSLLFLSLLLLLQNRKKTRETLLREQMVQLTVTQQKTRKGNGFLIGTLFMEKVSRLSGLSHQYFEAGDEADRTQSFLAFKKVAHELVEKPELFHELEIKLNQYCSGIMDKLKAQVPSIKGENRRIIALFFAGIPDPVVQIIMQRVSIGSLRTLRSRFRQTIKEAHAPDENLFLDMLDTEKQLGKKTNLHKDKNIN